MDKYERMVGDDSMKRVPSLRDVLLFDMGHGDFWISAVDSCGGIGGEPLDSLAVDPVITGMATARVPLLEIMAVGAVPVFASLAVTGGAHTAGPLIEGARKVLGDELPLIISTEKNMPVSVTGLGVTITGRCGKGDFRGACAKPGDRLYCAGRPLVGSETLKAGAVLFDLRHLEVLRNHAPVHTILPVGSRGIAAEAEILAKESGLQIGWNADPGVDLYRSAGPSTCAVFSAVEGAAFQLDLPVFEIGTLFPL